VNVLAIDVAEYTVVGFGHDGKAPKYFAAISL